MLSGNKKEHYWEKRGQKSFVFRNEMFYTITPIGLYYLRRQELLKLLHIELSKLPAGSNVLDFGCGDGYYTIKMKQSFPELNFYGCDISESMIFMAKKRSKKITGGGIFSVYKERLPYTDMKFNFIFSIAVFAHILDEKLLQKTTGELYEVLAPNGKVFLFEQTSNKKPIKGDTWIKRSEKEYISIFNQFKLSKSVCISYPNYMLFGRYFFYLIVYGIFAGDFIRANRSKWYQNLTYNFMKLTMWANRIFSTNEGNTLMLLEK